jgi:hypothetical protein
MRRLLLLPVLAIGLLLVTPGLAQAEDETGNLEVQVTLESRQKLPDDVLDELWSRIRIAGKCRGEKIAKSKFKVWPSGDASSRVIVAKDVPAVKCGVFFRVNDAKGRADVKVKAGGTGKGEATIQVTWARVSVDRLEEGDVAFLEWLDDGEREKVDLSTEPQIVPSRDYVFVLEHSGDRFDMASARSLKGDKVFQPYGTLVFNERAMVEGMRIVLDGKKRFAKDKMVLPARRWAMRLEAPGHRATEQTIDLKPGATYKWTRPLAKAKPGEVTLAVTGPDAWTIEVDGEPVETADAIEVDTGRHRIAVKAPGWKTVTERVELEERQKLSLEFALTPAPIKVTVGSLPEGTEVLLHPKGGEKTPWEVTDGAATDELAPGRYLVLVEAPDCEPWQESLDLQIGDEDLVLTPELLSNVIVLLWQGIPSGASLTVQEGTKAPRKVQVVDGRARAKVDAVRVVWTLRKTGMLTIEEALDLRPGEAERKVAVAMEKDPAFHTRIRRIAFAGGTGVLAVTGVALLGGSGASYKLAETEHEDYLSLSDSDEILAAKDRRDAAMAAGTGQSAAGWIFVGAAVGTGAAWLVTEIIGMQGGGKSKTGRPAPEVAPTVGPADEDGEGLIFGVVGRW